MSPEEIAQHLPEWVIPAGVDLDHLRDATEELIAEFSRPVRLVRQAASMSSSWSYVSEGNLDNAKWLYPHPETPNLYICGYAARLRERSDFTRVLQETVPDDAWVVEDSIHGLLSWNEIRNLGVVGKRAIRLEWLKTLKEKL